MIKPMDDQAVVIRIMEAKCYQSKNMYVCIMKAFSSVR